jgi:hypothetical protein
MHNTGNNEQGIRKKERELVPCRIVAETINEIEKTDYEVRDAEYQLQHCTEPVDVVLQSRTDSYPERDIQVTTIPSDLELRDDNTNVSKLEKGLRDALLERGVSGLQIDLNLTQPCVLSGFPPRLMGPLAETVQRMPRRDPRSVEWSGVWRLPSDLAGFVSDISAWPLPSGSVIVHAGRGCFVPEDDRFISEAIRKKSLKYSPSILSALALVIDASSTVVPAQIHSYLSTCKPSAIPFSEVWIVHAFGDRAIPLKHR